MQVCTYVCNYACIDLELSFFFKVSSLKREWLANSVLEFWQWFAFGSSWWKRLTFPILLMFRFRQREDFLSSFPSIFPSIIVLRMEPPHYVAYSFPVGFWLFLSWICVLPPFCSISSFVLSAIQLTPSIHRHVHILKASYFCIYPISPSILCLILNRKQRLKVKRTTA